MSSDPSRSRPFLILLKIVAPLAILALAGLGAYTLASKRKPMQIQRPTVLAPLVRVQRIELQDLELSVRSQGTVNPRTESQFVTEVPGRVVWVAPTFVPGGFFDAGAVLLRIDERDYQDAKVRAQAEIARAQLRMTQEEAESEVAQKEWARLGYGEPKPLNLREPQLADARAALAATEAGLAKALRDLERTQIKAPYAGRVRNKNVDVGQVVVAATPLGTIYAIDYAEVRLPLPDDQLAYLDLPLSYRGESSSRSGPSVTLTAEFAGKTHEWEGRIVRTEGEIDPATRMVNVVAQVKNPYARGSDPDRPPLAAGMYVGAVIQGRRVSGVAVLPRSALRVDGRLLLVDAEERLRFREVQLLRATREQIVVSNGLQEGDRVCLSSMDAVTDGMTVRTVAERVESVGTAADPVSEATTASTGSADGERR